MEIFQIVIVVLALLLVVMLVKFMGKAASFVFSILGIFIVVWLIIMGVRFLDEINIKNNLLDSNNLYILKSDNAAVTGFVSGIGLSNKPVDINLVSIYSDLLNINSDLYADYYKIIIVNEKFLPENIQSQLQESDNATEKFELFRNYVDDSLLEDDFVKNLIDAEKTGHIEVYKETLAFRHGIRETLTKK